MKDRKICKNELIWTVCMFSRILCIFDCIWMLNFIFEDISFLLVLYTIVIDPYFIYGILSYYPIVIPIPILYSVSYLSSNRALSFLSFFSPFQETIYIPT